MGIQFVGFVVMVLLALAVVGYGLFASRKSMVIALVALVVAFLAAGGAWYAWAESRDMAWTIGYAVVVVVSISSARRQFVGRIRQGQHPSESDE